VYSVFIVDDEPIVLEGIRTTIDWENSNFSFAGEASDGEIALSMIQEIKPDILITDIKMPFMDGLELSATIKKTQPWIKIIILSGHDEFDYAKKAISIGIEEYILKPFTSKEIIESLDKAAVQIDKERKQLSDITRMKEELKSTERIIQKDFLSGIVHNSIDMTSAMKKSQELNINLISRYYKILISKIQSATKNTQNEEMACSLVNSYSSSWEQTNSFFENNNQLVCICKGSDQKELDDNTYHIAETIEHIVTQNNDCRVVTTIGKTVEHLSSLSESYEDAKNRNIEIERLDGKISDNLSTAGNMAKYGAVTTASSLLSGFFLITVADISTTTGLGAVVSNAIAYGLIGGAGVFALASLPLIGAGFYGLKRLAA
jgi:two-component system response regulator YesN